jgi:hypothetical protein
VTWPHVFADLNKAITTLETANVAMDRPGWIFAPRTKGYLFALLNSQGIPVFRDEMLRGTLLGLPVDRITSQIPTNLATGAVLRARPRFTSPTLPT